MNDMKLKIILVVSAFQFFDTSPYLLKKRACPILDEGTCLTKQNIFFLFSTFMYIEKHADYMQINYFPLVNEKKKQEVNKGKRKLKYYLRLLLRFSMMII